MKLWSLFAFLTLSSHSGLSSQEMISIRAVFHDIVTMKNVVCKVGAIANGRKINLGQSNDSGFIKMKIPVSTKFLIFESEGYRMQRIPFRLVGKEIPDNDFYISIPMVPVDKQQKDKIYQQTEQQHYIQDASAPDVGTKKVLFDIKDVLSGDRLDSKICLTFTKTGRVKCFDVTTKSSRPALMLTQRDIVAFEVTSEGYQPYQGNLIIENLDGKEDLHTIGLLRQVNQLSLQITGQTAEIHQFSLHQKGRFICKLQAGNSPFQRYVSDIPFGTYQLIVSENGGRIVFNQNITLTPGINFGTVHLPSNENVRANQGNIVNSLYDSFTPSLLYTVYFNQSSYDLRKEILPTLDTIAGFLQNTPEAKVRLSGYTDNVGKQELNKVLSEYRSRVVASYLKQKGAKEKQIALLAMGGNDPVFPNDTEENKSKNRRVVIQIIPKENL